MGAGGINIMHAGEAPWGDLSVRRKLCAIECQVRPDPHCLDNHSAEHGANFIDQSMRAIVISWLIEVASEFALHQETLFLATALLDRFLSVSKVRRLPPCCNHCCTAAEGGCANRLPAACSEPKLSGTSQPVRAEFDKSSAVLLCRRCRGAACSCSASHACSLPANTRR